MRIGTPRFPVFKRCLAGLSLLIGLGFQSTGFAGPPEAVLARDGRAVLPVVVAADASEEVRHAAEELAEQLGRITGGEFTVQPGDGRNGIAVGVTEDFPALDVEERLAGEGLGRLQHYLLQSTNDGVRVIGATPQAVVFATWDLLHRIGHRQYFPGPNWEVVPHTPTLSIAVDVMESPSFYTREIWSTWGLHDFNRDHYHEWLRRNRAIGFSLQDRHAFRLLYERHREFLEANPHYLALVDGERKPRGARNSGVKFCLSQPEVRQFIVADRITELERAPDDSISIDPSDFGFWCECEDCAAMGSISDQVVILANEVAEAVVERFGPDRYVGVLAYNYHSPPPALTVHPNVIVSVATQFIKGGFTADELIDGWHRQGATIGVYEYYSRNITTYDLPGRAPVTNLEFLRKSIPAFHDRGVRFLRGQSTDTWGGYGLGYYVAKRLMWDRHEDVDTIVDDFLTRSFGEAREPMEAFFGLLYSERPVLLSEDLVGRMYRHLAQASELTDDPRILARIHDLALYTRYVDLYRQFDEAAEDERLEALGRMLSHSYKSRHSMMIHVRARWAAAFSARSTLVPPDEMDWDVPEGENPWKPESLYTAEEIDELIRDGIARHQLFDFDMRTFSRNLVPASKFLDTVAQASARRHRVNGWGTMSFYTWIHDAPAEIVLDVTGGWMHQNRGPVRVYLIPDEAPDDLPVDQAEVPPDGVTRTVELRTTQPGLHRIEVISGSGGMEIAWQPELPLTYEMSSETSGVRHVTQPLTAYFVVPRENERVVGYLEGPATIHDAEGNKVFEHEGNPGYFDLPVANGQAGTVWSIRGYRGTPRLLNVPAYLALDPRGLLVPAELID